ncbi:MAG: N-acetylmuramoyl-L-alanine amidase, partial [Sutterella sp.]|nr:N-acetylmuramoyl-L-alanine amidase [Sutterella sp.]
GGADPGAVGKRKTKEKTVVLAIAKQLAARINATRGMKAYLTRSTDVFLPLHKRAAFAINRKAHLFVSVHADAWTNPRANGSSVFTLSTHGASSLQARWLAQTQNKSDEIGGMDFRDVASQARSTVVDMLAETKLRYGIQLGDAVLEELARLGPLHKSTVEYAEFAVLKAQGVPSILVETAFISNPRDETRLTNKREQAHFATAIYKGILTAVERDPSLLKQS